MSVVLYMKLRIKEKMILHLHFTVVMLMCFNMHHGKLLTLM